MKAKKDMQEEISVGAGENDAEDENKKLEDLKAMLMEAKEETKAANQRAEVAITAANHRAEVAETKARKAQARATAAGSVPSQISDDGSISSDEEEPWMKARDAWSLKYKQLRDHRIAYGNCSKIKDSKLNNWINWERHKYRKSLTSKSEYCPKKAALLEGLGLDWGKDVPKTPTWKQNFESLKNYKVLHGNCNVPAEGTTPLAKWVSAQRIEYKRHKKQTGSLLTLAQIEQLNEIGFIWRQPR